MRRPFIALFQHHFKYELLSVRSLLIVLLLLNLIGLTVVSNLFDFDRRRFRERIVPVAFNIEPGAVQAQARSAIADFIRHSETHRLPCIFRNSVRLFSFFIPIVALLFSYNTVSKDIESGLVHSLYSLPLSKSTMIWGKIFGSMASLVVVILSSLGVVIAVLLLYGTLADLTVADIIRSGLYLLALAVYLLVFLLVGTFLSTISRRSTVALITSLVVVLMIIGASVTRDGISATLHPGYPDLPAMPTEVAQVMRNRRWGIPVRTLPSELAGYIEELHRYHADFYNRIRSRYRIERFLNFLSPANLHIEVASALLQDRFIPPYQIFAPVPLDEAHATIGQSLRYLLPEILFTLAMIMLLFWLNVRALTKLEV